VLPGAAAVLATLNTGVSAAARNWLEEFVLAKWQVGSRVLVQVSPKRRFSLLNRRSSMG
jgi:hypothetical protein